MEKLRGQVFALRDARRSMPEVRLGSCVKVGHRNARFWCKVRAIRGDGSVVGIVDNDLVNSSWRRGDEVVFQQSHVLEVAEPCDALTFRSLAAALWGHCRGRQRYGERGARPSRCTRPAEVVVYLLHHQRVIIVHILKLDILKLGGRKPPFIHHTAPHHGPTGLVHPSRHGALQLDCCLLAPRRHHALRPAAVGMHRVGGAELYLLPLALLVLERPLLPLAQVPLGRAPQLDVAHAAMRLFHSSITRCRASISLART